MSITKEQQQALDDALVPREKRLRIGNSNYKLSTTFKPKEPTFQIAFDVLSLTPFYQAFLITASVPAINMHEFWATFKLPYKRNMFQICPKVPGHKFVDPPFVEEILVFMSDLGYPEQSSTNVSVEDLVYQIENNVSKRNKDMYYPRFTKVIINHFMSQDQSILRRNKVDWHMASDNPILTTMRFIPQHEVVQKYGAILPDNLTTQAMKESEAYKTYYAFATRKAIPKPKYTLPATYGHVQHWLRTLAQKEDTRNSFDELMNTPLDFSAFVMNWLKVDTLTPKLLAGLTFELMKGSCKSLVELEYFLEEVYKATTDQLDWNNPEG
ncbi:hypothetical protein Tco_1462019, partial [Tanacetum coccineum]